MYEWSNVSVCRTLNRWTIVPGQCEFQLLKLKCKIWDYGLVLIDNYKIYFYEKKFSLSQIRNACSHVSFKCGGCRCWCLMDLIWPIQIHSLLIISEFLNQFLSFSTPLLWIFFFWRFNPIWYTFLSLSSILLNSFIDLLFPFHLLNRSLGVIA